MNWMKRMFRLGMATLLLMMLCMFSSAMAAEEAATAPLGQAQNPPRPVGPTACRTDFRHDRSRRPATR